MENKAQAVARAKAELRNSRAGHISGTFTVDGDPRLVSGNKVELTGMGRYNGVYLIRQATHTISKAGWSVSCEVQLVPIEVRLR
ncbi:phage late control protein GPD [compost metagenome]